MIRLFGFWDVDFGMYFFGIIVIDKYKFEGRGLLFSYCDVC